MKQKRKIIGALSLLVLFITYQTTIALFTHVHYVNGVLITHSHPFSHSHSHSKTSLVVIGQIPTFCSAEVGSFDIPHPMRALLAVFKASPTTPMEKGTAVWVTFLRAPPVYSPLYSATA